MISLLLLPFATPQVPPVGWDLVYRLAAIAALALLAGLFGSAIAMRVVQLVPPLWRYAEALVFVAGAVGAAAMVPIGSTTAPSASERSWSPASRSSC